MKKALAPLLLGMIFMLLIIILFESKFEDRLDLAFALDEEETLYQNVIDKEAIISKLKMENTLVSLSGNIEKTFGYKDKLYQSKFKWLDAPGQKKFEMTLHGNFKMGVNLNDIKPEHVFVKEETVKLIIPEPHLISLELPYDLIDINKEVGMLRRDFKETEKQEIYKIAKSKIHKHLIENENYLGEAKANAMENIKNLLLLIPNVKYVEFIEI